MHNHPTLVCCARCFGSTSCHHPLSCALTQLDIRFDEQTPPEAIFKAPNPHSFAPTPVSISHALGASHLAVSFHPAGVQSAKCAAGRVTRTAASSARSAAAITARAVCPHAVCAAGLLHVPTDSAERPGVRLHQPARCSSQHQRRGGEQQASCCSALVSHLLPNSQHIVLLPIRLPATTLCAQLPEYGCQAVLAVFLLLSGHWLYGAPHAALTAYNARQVSGPLAVSRQPMFPGLPTCLPDVLW